MAFIKNTLGSVVFTSQGSRGEDGLDASRASVPGLSGFDNTTNTYNLDNGDDGADKQNYAPDAGDEPNNNSSNRVSDAHKEAWNPRDAQRDSLKLFNRRVCF
ncbi:MAG: hypothetical protein J2P36_27095 [Ktedonobacteraceae bacterium]|nr:hypothetical protein [Ktedonobacteraceae bacterium]